MASPLPPEPPEDAGAPGPDLVERAGVLVATVVLAALVVWSIEGLRDDPAEPALRLALSAVAVGAGCCWISLLVSLRHPSPLERLGLTAASWASVAWASAAIVCLSHGLDGIATWIAPAGSPALSAARETLANAPAATLPILFAAVVGLSPLGEELLFRGLFQRSLRNAGAAPLVAVLASSALFGAAHGDWVYGGVAFALGLALGALLHVTGSLLPALVAHVANNAIALLEAREVLLLPALFGDPWIGTPLTIGLGVICLSRALQPPDGANPNDDSNDHEGPSNPPGENTSSLPDGR